MKGVQALMIVALLCSAAGMGAENVAVAAGEPSATLVTHSD